MILFVNKYITQIKQLYIFDRTSCFFLNIDIKYIHLHHLHLIFLKKIDSLEYEKSLN